MKSNVFPVVNLAHNNPQPLQGTATMNKPSFNSEWIAQRAFDGDTNQNYSGKSCVITQLQPGPLWWKVWLNRRFDIAYLEIYLRSDSKYV